MEAKLIKDHDDYHLVNDEQFVIGTTDESILSCTDKYKLSLKNCQAIELGYDLDGLVKEEAKKRHDWSKHRDTDVYNELVREDSELIKIGFQKALEILGDKKFSEEDMVQLVKSSFYAGLSKGQGKNQDFNIDDYVKEHLQQTEWDVEIVMDICGDKVYAVPEPKLDEDGCLILKLKL